MQTFKATDTGKSAMAEVEAAIKKLPKGVFLETDEDRGVVMFWRRTPQGPGSAVQIGEIRCKQRVQL